MDPPGGHPENHDVPLASSATIDEGTGKIVLTLDQSLKPHLIQLKEFYTTMNITYTLPMKSQYSLKIYELCKSYQNLYITKKEKGEPLVWNIETLKKQVDCNAANWATCAAPCWTRPRARSTATPTSILTMSLRKRSSARHCDCRHH